MSVNAKNIRTSSKEWELDALTEICNMGAGHAATALSQLLDCKVNITVPQIEMVGPCDLAGILGNTEARVTAVHVQVLGTAPGNMLFLLPPDSAGYLASVLLKKKVVHDKMTAIDRKTIKQAGAIIISSYLNALTSFLDSPFVASEADIADDMIGVFMETMGAKFEDDTKHALVVQTDFIDESMRITSKICFLPDPGGAETILEKLKTKGG